MDKSILDDSGPLMYKGFVFDHAGLCPRVRRFVREMDAMRSLLEALPRVSKPQLQVQRLSRSSGCSGWCGGSGHQRIPGDLSPPAGQ